MVGQSLWKNLKYLVTIDKQIDELGKNISKTKTILDQDKLDIPKLEKIIKQYQADYAEKNKLVTQEEITSKELKEKEKKERELLEKSANEKEYKALERGLKQVLYKRKKQDDVLINAWHLFEEAKNNIDVEKPKNEEQIINLKKGIDVQTKAIEDSKNQQNELITQRKVAEGTIPQEWLDKYERMRHKVEDPIVPVLGESCSACYYSILRQDLSKLKKAGVLPCRNCYRFLYYDKSEEEESQEAAY